MAAPCSAAAGRAGKKGKNGKNELSPPSTGTGTSGSGAGGFVTTRGVLGKASSERPHAFNSAYFGQTSEPNWRILLETTEFLAFSIAFSEQMQPAVV